MSQHARYTSGWLARRRADLIAGRTMDAHEQRDLLDLLISERKANTDSYRAFVEHVYGQMSVEDMNMIVDRDYTPPLPLERHAKAMGIIK